VRRPTPSSEEKKRTEEGRGEKRGGTAGRGKGARPSSFVFVAISEEEEKGEKGRRGGGGKREPAGLAIARALFAGFICLLVFEQKKKKGKEERKGKDRKP